MAPISPTLARRLADKAERKWQVAASAAGIAIFGPHITGLRLVEVST